MASAPGPTGSSALWSKGMNSASMPLCTLTQTCGRNSSRSVFIMNASGSENGAVPGYSSLGS